MPNVSSYVYCFNNPVKYVDPDGKHPVVKWLIKKGIPLFLSGVAINTTIQYSANYMFYKDAKMAFNDLDVFDIAISGGVNVVTSGGSTIRSLFSQGTKTAIMKGTSIITLELLSASTDLKFDGSGFESLFNDKKEVFDVTSSLVLSLSASFGSDKIATILKNWAKADLDPKLLAIMTKEQKENARMIYNFVKSESFINALDINSNIINEYVNKIINSNAKITIESKLNSGITQEKDNTNIGSGYGF